MKASEILTHLRIITIACVEGIDKWRTLMQSYYNIINDSFPSVYPIYFSYMKEGKNYLLKVANITVGIKPRLIIFYCLAHDWHYRLIPLTAFRFFQFFRAWRSILNSSFSWDRCNRRAAKNPLSLSTNHVSHWKNVIMMLMGFMKTYYIKHSHPQRREGIPQEETEKGKFCSKDGCFSKKVRIIPTSHTCWSSLHHYSSPKNFNQRPQSGPVTRYRGISKQEDLRAKKLSQKYRELLLTDEGVGHSEYEDANSEV